MLTPSILVALDVQVLPLILRVSVNPALLVNVVLPDEVIATRAIEEASRPKIAGFKAAELLMVFPPETRSPQVVPLLAVTVLME
jgi:hypothetical protein